MRGRSYTPSPPRGYGRRERSPSPRGRYGGGSGSRGNSRDLPTSLLVRNLRHDCRPDDLRRPFGQFGALKDIYLPKDYYTGEPRGFGFIQYVDPADATEAKYHMDGQILHGRQVTVVFAEENRKKPTEMRARDRGSGRRYHVRRSPRYSRSQYSRSPPRYASSRSHERDYYSPPPKMTYSRSVSPRERSYLRQSQDRLYSRSPGHNGGSRSRSHSPVRGPSRSRSRSQSPNQRVSRIPNHYPRESNGDRSPTP